MSTDTQLEEAVEKIIANMGERTYKRIPQSEQITRDKEIILMYANKKSLAEIGRHFGITRARAHQIILAAIKNHTK